MAGRKFGIVMMAYVPASFFSLPQEEQDAPGKVWQSVIQKYAGKVDFVRRYWTRAFSTEVTDVFIMECDDLMDAHNMHEEMYRSFAKGGDPDRYGQDVAIYVGVNPDADK